MKRQCAAVLVAVLLATLAVSVAGAAADPFLGVWVGIDPDGSNVRLVIRPALAGYGLHYADDMASACFGDRATALGAGALDNGVLKASLDVWCLSPHRWLAAVDEWLTYDPVNDTLIDPWVTWSRVSGG